MKTTYRKIVVLLSAVVMTCIAPAWVSGVLPASTELHRTKRIFVKSDSARVHDSVVEALSRYGFVVLDSESEADAVMDGGRECEEVVLDGDQPVDPPRYCFQFRLVSQKFNLQWQTEFVIGSRKKGPEIERRGGEKAAQNLFDAWKQSAKKAGIKVGNRVP